MSKGDASGIKALLAARRQERATEEAVRFGGALFRPLEQVENDADWKNPAKIDNITDQILPDTDPLQQHPDQHDFRATPIGDGKGWQRVAENDQATEKIPLETGPLHHHPDQHEFRSAPTIEDPSADWQRVEKSYNSKKEMPLDTEPSQGSSALATPRAFDTLQGDLEWKHSTGEGATITDQITVDATPSEGQRILDTCTRVPAHACTRWSTNQNSLFPGPFLTDRSVPSDGAPRPSLTHSRKRDAWQACCQSSSPFYFC